MRHRKWLAAIGFGMLVCRIAGGEAEMVVIALVPPEKSAAGSEPRCPQRLHALWV